MLSCSKLVTSLDLDILIIQYINYLCDENFTCKYVLYTVYCSKCTVECHCTLDKVDFGDFFKKRYPGFLFTQNCIFY